MKIIKVWTLKCAECALEESSQPCEACPNYAYQQTLKGSK